MEETIIGAEKKEEIAQPTLQEIFKAVYNVSTGSIQISINTNHLPILPYAQKLLDLEITNKFLESLTKPKEEKKIITPDLAPIIDLDKIRGTPH